MEFPSNIILVGLGHKARNGKDTTALTLKDMHPNTHIFHWANGVYDEVSNTNGWPLILANGDRFYLLTDREKIHYKGFLKSEFPKLQRIFDEREIGIYEKMVTKDPEILQFWGTNFRRERCDPDYWVKKTLEDIKADSKSYSEGKTHLVAIADTRFKNERAAVKKFGGAYVEVIRYKEPGVRFICPDRDPTHPSEVDLDGVAPDFTLHANNLKELRECTETLLRFLLPKR